MTRPLAALAALALAGCTLTPQAYCNQVVQLTCDRTYECATEPVQQDALKRLYADKDDCLAKWKAQMGCDSYTAERACGTQKTWNGAKASACMGDYRALTCAQLQGGLTSLSLPNCTSPCE